MKRFLPNSNKKTNSFFFSPFFLVMFMLITVNAFGQTTGDYRSVATGNWTTLSTWQYYNGSAWVTPSGTTPQGYPGQFTGTNHVTIQAGHNVTLNNISTQPFTLFTVNGTLTFSGTGGNPIFDMKVSTVIITSGLTPVATVNFTTKGTWQLPTNAILNVGTGGLSGNCTANQSILIGTTFFSYCNGGGSSVVTFADLMASGGTLNAVATSNSPICKTQTINLTGSITGLPGTGLTYTWTITNPLGGITTVSSQNTTVTNALAGTYTAKLVCTSSYPGISSYSNEETISVIVRQLPTSVISGTQTICNGDTTSNLSIALTGTQPWSLTYTDGTTPVTVSGITSSPYTFTVSPSATATYTVSALSDANCSSEAGDRTGSAVITVNPRPTSVISGSQAICNGATTSNLSIALTGTQPWSLTYTDGTTPVTVSGITSSPYTFTVSPTATATYTVSALNDANCTSQAGDRTGSAVITVNNIFISGAILTTGETVCYNGDPASIGNATVASGGDETITYKWQANGNDIPSSNSASYDPPAGLTTTTTYTRYAKDDTCNTTFTLSSGSWVVTVTNSNTWTGSVSTSWTNAANWSCGVVPASVSDVTISTASNYPEISSNVTINTLTLNSATTLKINPLFDLTITDVIVNNGTLTVENNANLIQVNDVTNTGSGSTIVKRNSNPLIRLDYTMWSSPVSGQGLYAFSPFTFANRFYIYNTSTNLFSNSVGFNVTGLNGSGVNGTDNNSVPFATGIGYLIRLPYNHPTAPATWTGNFTGTPNNGTKTITLNNVAVGQRFNLVGNPYPSPIDIAQFATDNSSNIESTLYFWRKTNNTASPSYCTWNTASSTYGDNGEAYTESPLGVIRTGQGFIVEAKAAATSVEFNNGQRIDDNANQFFRNNPNTANTNNEAHRIWLNLTGATNEFSQMVVGYFTNATQGADEFDSKYFNDGAVALNTKIGSTEYVIQGRALPFQPIDVVPMNFKVTNAGTYTFTIDHVDGLFTAGAQDIFIKDNLNGTYNNLNTSAYTFTSEAGTFADRFEIVYQLPLDVDSPIFNANQVIIYKNRVNDFVINTGNVVMSKVKVFDIRGRMLLERSEINGSQVTITTGQGNEVLLVQITSQDGLVVTKKVIR